MSMTAVSLFAGVGGIDLALERAGIRVTTAVEIDRAARGVLADRFPMTTLRPDVTKVSADELRADGFAPERGILAAGWPCQGNSVAGRRGGMADPRSGLWSHVVRLLAETRPRWFLGENVPGLLSVNGGRDFGVVVQDLADLGYGFTWRVLDAQHFGVPQRRRRVVIVGRLGDDRRPVEVLLEPEGGGGHPAACEAPGTEPAARVGQGIGHARIASALTAREGKGPDSDATTTLIVQALTANGVGTGGADDNQAQAGHLVTYQKVIRPASSDHPDVWERRVVAATLSPFDLGSDSRAVELVVCATGERTHALTAEGHDGSEDGTGRGTPLVAFHLTQDPISGQVVPALGGKSGGAGLANETTVRRLTPRETERLQGFPDDWTATSNGRPQADSPRYQQMGNAVAVPVFEWVARRIVASERGA